MSRIGRFWVVGVGPGDPDLLTVKAVRLLQQVGVIYHAGRTEGQGRAWDVIRGLLRPDQQVRVVRTETMSAISAAGGTSAYRTGVEQIAADCRRGLDVALATEGDPTLYSTAANVWSLLAELDPAIPIEVVPGVSSITAAAARVGWPLAQKDDMLAVVPATYHPADFRCLLNSFATVCFLKAPRTLPQLAQTLEAYGPQRQAVYVEDLGAPREWITHDLREAVGRPGYFALVLVRRTRGEAAGWEGAGAPGKIWVVGLGPGDPRLLTQQALEVLRTAEVVIGYDAYLNALAPLGLTAEFRGYPIGAEAARAAQALELAGAGRRVALVSSGDAGVYGMASLLLETAGRMPDVEIEVVPGVTAAVSAAALLGAPLGHDFACVSLSDLLTPWEVIERRLEAAGQGDFVLVLYNPVSQRRTWQLARAREILLKYRQPQTLVGLVDKAYRPGTRVWQTNLADLTSAGVSMETTLVIGGSQTRLVNRRLVTPRGYGDQV